MDIGVPRETAPDETRVGLTPAAAGSLVRAGHRVFLETGAGAASRFEDADYEAVGAAIQPTAADVFSHARLIVKVNAPGKDESAALGADHLILAFFHFSGSLTRTELMLNAGSVCIAYESVTAANQAPLLSPMSEVAGSLAALLGAGLMALSPEGRGVLPGGLAGVAPAQVGILGGGVLGARAARVFGELGAQVTVIERCPHRLALLHDSLPASVQTRHASDLAIEQLVCASDLLIGAAGDGAARTPQLVSREQLAGMRPGAIIFDATADQGGCFETTRATSWSAPTYEAEGVRHFCVQNLAGRAGRSASQALSGALLPYLLELANEGYRVAARNDTGLAAGIQLIQGRITHAAVAEAFGMEHVAVASLLG